MTRFRDAGLFAFLALAWGGSFVAVEAGLQSLPPVFFAAARFDLGALLLVAYAVATRERWFPRTRDDVFAVAVVGAFVVAGNNALLFLGQQNTTAGVAAVLYSLNPVLTTGFARGLLPDERLSAVGVVGLLVGLAGVALVVRPDPANLTSGAVGKLLVVASASSVALGSVLLRRTDPDADSVTTTGWAMLVGALVMHALSIARGESLPTRLDPAAVVPLVYLAVVATAAAYAVYFGLLERHGPVEINLVSYVVPIVAALAGWALLEESLASATIVGFAVILVGFALVKRGALADVVGGHSA
ncbi:MULTISPECIES: DMT family transporter [Halorussus]|uniref:DMT family transporter n=1 Tax=Halorussus TaxID=1070314 RepID=UPI00209FD26E|nr:DMT family transporter [Halorussus vallis]USZ75578.1 DMT family transporter [Halorussus vallis]